MPARHPDRRRARQVARRRVGKRGHVIHRLVHQVVGEHHAGEERVAPLQDRVGVVEQRGLQRRLEQQAIVGEQLLVRLAVVLDEGAQRRDGTVVAVSPVANAGR
jgi:hypothetical protein